MIMLFLPSNILLMELGGMIDVFDRTCIWRSCDRPNARSLGLMGNSIALSNVAVMQTLLACPKKPDTLE